MGAALRKRLPEERDHARFSVPGLLCLIFGVACVAVLCLLIGQLT